jgi:hypothetical protein
LRLLLKEFSCITLTEEEWLKEPPNGLIATMLGHNVCRIEFVGQMVEPNKLSGNSFMNMVEGESIMALVHFGMRDHQTINNCLVISKHVASVMDRNTKILKGGTKINNLIDTRTGGNELRSISGSFHSSLFLVWSTSQWASCSEDAGCP